MASSMIDALLAGERVSKHEGPGPHPSGTPQAVHAGGKGTRAWASALNSMKNTGDQGDAIREMFGDQPGFERFAKAASVWLAGVGVHANREVARSDRSRGADGVQFLRDTGYSERDIDGFRLLTRTVANAPSNAPEMYRGLTVERANPEDVRAAFTRGTEFSMNGLASFSEDEDFASKWANWGAGSRGATPVVFRVREKAKALHLAPMAPRVFQDQKEWVTGGRYRVIGRDRLEPEGDLVTVDLVQVEGPKQQVRKRMGTEELRSRIIDMMSTPLPKDDISKHEGPGNHPSGSSQEVHGGGNKLGALARRLNKGEKLDYMGGDEATKDLLYGLMEWTLGPGPSLLRAIDREDRGGKEVTEREKSIIGDALNPDYMDVDLSDTDFDSEDEREAFYEKDLEDHTSRTVRGLRALRSAVSSAPKNAPELWRGFSVTPDHHGAFSKGARFSTRLGSFSQNEETADAYAHDWRGEGEDASLMFRLLPGSRSLDARSESPFDDQEEWVSGGTFEVDGVERRGDTEVVTIRQVEGPEDVSKASKAEVREHIVGLLESSLPNPVPRSSVTKHLPGEHEQKRHAGDQPGRERGAIDTPFGMDGLSDNLQKAIAKTVAKREREHKIDLSEDTLVDRLRGLWDQSMGEDRERFEQERKWYQSANEYGSAVGEAFGADERKASAILAALSPQTGWGRNQDMAADLMGLLYEDPVIMDPGTRKRKRVSDMSSGEAARLLSGLSHPEVRVADGSRSAGLFDQNITNLEKAIGVYRGEDVDRALGGSKVRSFFNNILLPGEKTSWTDDTHMKRIWLDDPDVGSEDKKIRHLWAPAPTSKAEGYSSGIYPYFSSVGGKAADELGVLPHEVQAVTWSQWRRNTGVEDRDTQRGMADLDAAIKQFEDENPL